MTKLKKFALHTLLIASASAPLSAADRTVYTVGVDPSERTKLAFPLARCIWSQNYQDALAYVNGLEKGMRPDDALKRLDELKIGCSGYPEGDIIQAIVSLREEQVGLCLRRNSNKVYDQLVRRMRGHQNSEEAKIFVINGFPLSLSDAIVTCDPSLQDEYGPGYRKVFGIVNFGWNWLFNY